MEVSFGCELQSNTKPDVVWVCEGSAIVVNGEVLSRQITSVLEFYVHVGTVLCFLVSLEAYSPAYKDAAANEINEQLEGREDWRNKMDIHARGAAKNGTRTRP